MDSIKIELQVLIECLRKKEQALKQIADITENQGFVLSSGAPHDEIYSYFMQMNTEKQTFIQKVMQCDEVFTNMLEKIGPTLDADPKKYREQVITLQDLIRAVTDVDVRIRVIEDKNTQVLTEELRKLPNRLSGRVDSAEKPETIQSGEYGKSHVIDAYKNQSRHRK